MKYQRGLALLKQRLGSDHVRYPEWLVFEQRLTDTIDRARIFGDTAEIRHDLAQIVSGLNTIAMDQLGMSFNDLCAEALRMHEQQLSAIPAYYLSPTVVDLLTTICTTSGYHLVLAEAGFGKTALMGYLAQRRRPEMVTYTFTRMDGRKSVDLALVSLREQLRSRGNLPSAHHYPLAELLHKVVRIHPWSVARRRSWPQLLILLDGLDECDHSERLLFHELLPAQLPANVGVVVTMRPAVREAIEAHFASAHPLRRSANVHGLSPLSVADIRRILFEQHHIYAESAICEEIRKLSDGLPAAVISLCRMLEDAIHMEHDPDEVLKQIPPLHTFGDLFDHELEQMESRCASEKETRLLRLILATLAVAQQSLAAGQVAEVLEVAPSEVEALGQRLDRFHRPTGDNILAFSHPQFAEYLLKRMDWGDPFADARARYAIWIARQQATQPLAAEFILRAHDHFAPALRAYPRADHKDWADLFSPMIRSREDWLTMIAQAWDAAEHPLDPQIAAPGGGPEELLIYALLMTSWPHTQATLPPRGELSSDYQYSLVLTDQLRNSTGPVGPVESRDFATLMGLLAGNTDDTSQPSDPLVILVSELGQSWLMVSECPHHEFATILRLITQFVRRQAIVSPLPSPRANLLDALSALAPAIRYHFPDSVERICYLIDNTVEIFP